MSSSLHRSQTLQDSPHHQHYNSTTQERKASLTITIYELNSKHNILMHKTSLFLIDLPSNSISHPSTASEGVTGAGSLSKDDIYQLLCTYKLSVRVYPLNGSWSIMRLHVLFSIVIVDWGLGVSRRNGTTKSDVGGQKRYANFRAILLNSGCGQWRWNFV
jgi:hypothetical protein